MKIFTVLSYLVCTYGFIVHTDPQQSKVISSMQDPKAKIIIVTGVAGTGKTYIVCKEAVEQLKKKSINKIILTRPTVTVSEEELGYLPGKIQDKMYPWMKPLLDVLEESYERKELDKLFSENKVEYSPLAFMRGRTFKNSLVILDEAQNTLPSQMKMFLTRIGSSSKLIIIGDVSQSDIKEVNGLQDFLNRLKIHYENIHEIYNNGIHLIKLKIIYRSEIIQKILDLY